MNIFYLNKSPIVSAQNMVDKHVVKMILETAQLLCTAHRILDDIPNDKNPLLYKATHKNHPSAIWARASLRQYEWLYNHLIALGEEYTYRYGKTHITITKLGKLLKIPPENIPDVGFDPPPCCMDDEYKISKDVVDNYRNYYKNGKSHLHSWKVRSAPEWI